MKIKFLSISLIFIILVLFGIFVLTPITLNKQDGVYWYLKAIVPESVKIFIKRNFLNAKLLENQNKDLNLTLEKVNENYFTLRVSNELNKIENTKIKSKNEISYSLKKIFLPFDAQNAWKGKPSGYIEEFRDFLIISSGKGEFIRIRKKDLNLQNIKFENIKNNLTEMVKFKEFYTPGNFGIRDLKVIDEKLYVSYPKEIKSGCFNISILEADLKTFDDELIFNEFFSFNDCLGAWLSTRSGGRIEKYNDKILFSIGDYGLEVFDSPQNLNHPFGKIILINKLSRNYDIVSFGHRNPQGLYYDKENDILIETEHGPDGGDEVNKINLKNDITLNNFGWPISSYGSHYKGTVSRHKEEGNYEKLIKTSPLKKSHKKYGFIEPIKNWTPSIGVSQVTKINNNFLNNANNDFFVSSLGNNVPEGDMTIHHLSFNNDFNEILFEDRIIVGERIRDIQFSEDLNSILMITENSPSLSILTKSTN